METVKTQFWNFLGGKIMSRISKFLVEFLDICCGLHMQPLKTVWNFIKFRGNSFKMKFHEISFFHKMKFHFASLSVPNWKLYTLSWRASVAVTPIRNNPMHSIWKRIILRLEQNESCVLVTRFQLQRFHSKENLQRLVVRHFSAQSASPLRFDFWMYTL